MKIRNLIFIVITFFLVSCKKEIKKPKMEYNQKANELIAQLICDENCDCILEIPQESMIEFDTLEYPNFEYENYYIQKLSLKNKRELDSLNNLSKKFVLDTKLLNKSNLKIIKRDSIRILNKDINYYSKTCKNLKYLLKPIFNKTFTIAIIDYGEIGMCMGMPNKQIFEYKNKKWNRKYTSQ